MIVIFLQLAGYFLLQGFNAMLQSKFPRCYFAGTITCILPKTIMMQEKIFGAIFCNMTWRMRHSSLSQLHVQACLLFVEVVKCCQTSGIGFGFLYEGLGLYFLRHPRSRVPRRESVEMGSNSRLPVHVPRSLFDILQLRSSQTSNERFVYQ